MSLLKNSQSYLWHQMTPRLTLWILFQVFPCFFLARSSQYSHGSCMDSFLLCVCDDVPVLYWYLQFSVWRSSFLGRIDSCEAIVLIYSLVYSWAAGLNRGCSSVVEWFHDVQRALDSVPSVEGERSNCWCVWWFVHFHRHANHCLKFKNCY